MENKETELTTIASNDVGSVTGQESTDVTSTSQVESAAAKDVPTNDSPQPEDTSVKSNIDVGLSKAETAPAAVPVAKSASYVPPVKRFAAVNMSRKFLEKASTTSTSSNTLSGHVLSSSNTKQNGTIAKPTPQSAFSQSRLVTAKLTATSSSTTGAGWSRPTSVTPPVPANSTNPTGSGANNTFVSQNAAQTSATGKAIAPQARPNARQMSDGRPVWGNVAQNSNRESVGAQSEFPTAAEAAQGRKPKGPSQKIPETASIHDQNMDDTADAFRGVHLDPNAHHWDEMDEDGDDDYLGEVIEFGDGRQYTIQVVDGDAANRKQDGGDGNRKQDDGGAATSTSSTIPVNKNERFAEDFDRSWPRSRNGQPGAIHHQQAEGTFRNGLARSEASSTVSASPLATRDANQSRVLFNERSNRMEPYAVGHHPSGPGAPPHRRVGIEPWGRQERDVPPHAVAARTQLQVLQKPGRPAESEQGPSHRPLHGLRDRRDADSAEVGSTFSRSSDGQFENRSRRYSNARSTTSNTSSREQKPLSREQSRSRDGINAHAHPSPVDNKSNSSGKRDSTHPNEPNSSPLDRQLPPHMIHRPPPPPPSKYSSDSRSVGSNIDESTGSKVPAIQTESSISPASAAVQPPAQSIVDSLPNTDVEALRKAFLHERAEQAKHRRQQEEEERAKAQERARQKALELEAKLAAKSAPKAEILVQPAASEENRPEHRLTESQVLSVIEEAVKSVPPPSETPSQPRQGQESQPQDRPSVPNAWGQRQMERTVSGRNTGQRPASIPVTESDQTESWRKPRFPSAPSVSLNNSEQKQSYPATAPTLPLHAAGGNEILDVVPGEHVEVIDFSDLGKLVGATSSSERARMQEHHDVHSPRNKPSRPTASDFFDAPREVPVVASGGSLKQTIDPSHTKTTSFVTEHPAEFSPLPSPSLSNLPNGTPASPGRTVRHPSFREVPLSALDDTMSRIKGVLDGMQTSTVPGGSDPDSMDSPTPQTESNNTPTLPTQQIRHAAPLQTPAPPRRWLPPALRPASVPELFEVTRLNLLDQDVVSVVRLPRRSLKVYPIPRHQFQLVRTPPGPVRWDILSFEPPVEGMNRRTLSVNDILFGKPPPPHRIKYRVSLPKSRRFARHAPPFDALQNRPNLPAGAAPQMAKSTSLGAFGRPGVADQTSWRTVVRKSSADSTAEAPRGDSALNVTSRSPPPETAVGQTTVNVTLSTSAPELTVAPRKNKHPARMPEGADVAFSRSLNVGLESTKSSTRVSFTVTSELDSGSDGVIGTSKAVSATSTTSPKSQAEILSPTMEADHSPELVMDETTSAERILPSTTPQKSSLLLDVADIKVHAEVTALEVGGDVRAGTPTAQHSGSIWGKSPSRAPDREHLKAVWSQTSDRDAIPTVNSLKEIVDDLTAVPFSLHEAKLEDEGTPPPVGPVSAPLRMSASDVTRAFQTVPVGPAGPSSRPIGSHTFSPTSHVQPLSPPRPIPPPIGMPPPTMMNGSRPVFMGYTPMQSHSPSPTMIYPQLPHHVIQNQMRPSPSSPYGQPMWMSVQNHGPQHSPQMMRAQPTSPYGAPVMSYQTPAQSSLYPPNTLHHNPQAQPNPYASAHPHQRMSLISPVLPAASPVHPPVSSMYSTSPMLVHVPPPGGANSSQPYPGTVGMGRSTVPAQPPIDNRQHGHAAPHMTYTGHAPAYSHVPPHSFVRPNW